MEIKPAVFVIADISGYTTFTKLHRYSLIHAEKIITDLLEAILDETDHPLEVYRLEGDAIFFYSAADDPAELAAHVHSAVDQIVTFFEVFARREEQIISCRACVCEACNTAEKLRLKVLIHAGESLFKTMLGKTELAGEDVILIHRLLKNEVAGDEYFLLTDAAHSLADNLPDWKTIDHHEQVADMGPQHLTILYPKGLDAAPPPTPDKAPLSAILGQIIRFETYTLGRALGLVRQDRKFNNLPE